MNYLQTEIARFLASKALRQTKTTYQQLAEGVGWSHPTGRGLGPNLEAVLRYCHEQGLPPLTLILVEKRKPYPSPDSMGYIRAVLGNIDLDQAQQQVFAFDWNSLEWFASETAYLPGGQAVWLTSFWGFTPSEWGCIGFADQHKRTNFIRRSKPGGLMAIYVTKGKGPESMKGKVVGVYEMSHQIGDAEEFIAGNRWREKEFDPASRGKWSFAVKATRAWKIVEEQWQPVEELFPETYENANAQLIGSSGVKLSAHEAEKLLALDMEEVAVYGQRDQINPVIRPLLQSLLPSRAVLPASTPYMVGETDGPKFLYILRLSGNIAAYLGCAPDEVSDKSIIKVGFSKHPLTRRNQIQRHYPSGAYHWEILHPRVLEDPPPYANALIATAGEDSMKARLVDPAAQTLGHEFYLAEDWLVEKAWAAGVYAANTLQSQYNAKVEGKT